MKPNRPFIGRTTGSHLDLPWREEFQDPIIWIADVEGERVSLWKIVADTPETRQAYGSQGNPIYMVCGEDLRPKFGPN